MFDISKIPKFHIYCDESSQTQNRYLVIGAIFCSADIAPNISNTINLIMKSYGSESELKWAKATRMNKDMYLDIYRAISQMIDANYLQFYALVVDTSKVNHKQYNDGDRDLGFTKFLFTLLYKFARIFRTKLHRYYVFLDDRTTQHTPEKLKFTLNAKARKELNQEYDKYRLVEFVDSKKSRLVQLADIMSGLIAYDSNLHYTKVGAAKHKIEIAEKVREMFNVRSFSLPTPYGRADGFDIWRLDFDAAKRRAVKA